MCWASSARLLLSAGAVGYLLQTPPVRMVTCPKVAERKYLMTWTRFVSIVRAESKLGRRVLHLRCDREKAFLINNTDCCERRTDGQTPLEEALKLQKCHGILCAEGERELCSDLYSVWTGIPSRTCESRAPQSIKFLKMSMHVLHPLLPPPSVIHSDMVYDPEYTTGLYQREPQTLWTVASSSECYIWTHTD